MYKKAVVSYSKTVVKVNHPKYDITIEKDSDDLDGLNYLAGKTIDEVNTKAFEGTLLAHTDGGVPNMVVNIPQLDEKLSVMSYTSSNLLVQ